MGHGLTIRGDALYCPLSLSLDSYWNCEPGCLHCPFRRLNRTWGRDLRPIDPDELHRKLVNGVANSNPRSPLAHALAAQRTIRWGSKSDPFQDAERRHRLAGRIFSTFRELNWSYVIQTMFTGVLMDYEDAILQARDLATVQPIISPGTEKDWELLERKRTTPPGDRIEHAADLKRQGVNVGVIGEPFIPGWHTVAEFKDTLQRLKAAGIYNYNTYNLHFNDHVAKRMVNVPGVDLVKIWEMNQDARWGVIQRELCDVADALGMILGCPDFVNVRPDRLNTTNTCCGVDVPNPTRFNTHTWRNMVIAGGLTPEHIANVTYDGIGDREKGLKILRGESSDFYTFADAGLIKAPRDGFGF